MIASAIGQIDVPMLPAVPAGDLVARTQVEMVWIHFPDLSFASAGDNDCFTRLAAFGGDSGGQMHEGGNAAQDALRIVHQVD